MAKQQISSSTDKPDLKHVTTQESRAEQTDTHDRYGMRQHERAGSDGPNDNLENSYTHEIASGTHDNVISEAASMSESMSADETNLFCEKFEELLTWPYNSLRFVDVGAAVTVGVEDVDEEHIGPIIWTLFICME